jgi:hypothetical protein
MIIVTTPTGDIGSKLVKDLLAAREPVLADAGAADGLLVPYSAAGRL